MIVFEDMHINFEDYKIPDTTVKLYRSISEFSRRQIDNILFFFFFFSSEKKKKKKGFEISSKLSQLETACIKCQIHWSQFTGNVKCFLKKKNKIKKKNNK